MLELQDVNAFYGKVHVLQGVTMSVGEGESVAVLGRNGVGKTTTLKTIMGLVATASGRITFDGQDLSKIRPHQIPSCGIGYVPQGRGIFPTLTVRENLFIGAPRNPKKHVEDYVFERFPRLKERLVQSGGTLSGGEQQMLAIARCLMMEPRLIILDEPTEGIMPILVQDIRREIKEVNDNGVSILLIEQNVKTALRLCNHVYIMEKGVIVHDGTAEDVGQQEDVLHRHLGVSG